MGFVGHALKVTFRKSSDWRRVVVDVGMAGTSSSSLDFAAWDPKDMLLSGKGAEEGSMCEFCVCEGPSGVFVLDGDGDEDEEGGWVVSESPSQPCTRFRRARLPSILLLRLAVLVPLLLPLFCTLVGGEDNSGPLTTRRSLILLLTRSMSTLLGLTTLPLPCLPDTRRRRFFVAGFLRDVVNAGTCEDGDLRVATIAACNFARRA